MVVTSSSSYVVSKMKLVGSRGVGRGLTTPGRQVRSNFSVRSAYLTFLYDMLHAPET